MLSPKIPVAKEGLPFIGIASLGAVIFALLGWPAPALTLFAVAVFILYFFRDPERVVPPEAGLIVSPADGRVIEVCEAHEGALQGGDVLRISIFMTVFNVHVNRAPVSGTVRRIAYQTGVFWPADKQKALIQNEQNALLLEGTDGLQMTVVQVAGLLARRIVCWAEVGDTLKRGERFGLIRFGSRLDVYLPKKEVEVLVKRGDRVWAGQTVLARGTEAVAAQPA